MTSDELEELLQGQSETQSLDFKGPCAWVAARLAKDTLAAFRLNRSYCPDSFNTFSKIC
jgi:hypothetical protein